MKRKKPSKSSPSFGNPEIQQIEQLFQFMTEHNLEEFEYSRGDLSIRLRKPSAGLPVAPVRAVAAPEIIVPGSLEASQELPEGAVASAAEARSSEELHLVKSPIVGTYYESPSPGTEAFVQVGTYVEAGQVLCIVEAMEVMNEIAYNVSRVIMHNMRDKGQPDGDGMP